MFYIYLKDLLYQHSFYSTEEYFKYKENKKNIKTYVSVYSKCVRTNMFSKSCYVRFHFCCISL